MDLFLIFGTILTLALVILLGYTMVSKLNDRLQVNNDITTKGKTASTTVTNYFPGLIDNSFLLIAVFLSLGVIILAALVRVHPIFILPYFILWIFLVFISGFFSNAYYEAASNPNLIAYANQLTFTSNVMLYLPWVSGGIGLILMLIMFKAWRDDQ